MGNTRTPVWPLLIVGLGTLVVPLDSAVNVDFPAIVARFGLSIPMIQWVVISYVLTQTSLMLTFGRAGDMVGYRRIFLWGTGFSTLAFTACALAPSYPFLLAGRVAQGVGAGLILSCGPALATSLFPEAMRTRILGYYMLMFGIGTALGPSVFGPLVQVFGWGSVFAFRAPLAFLAFLLTWTLPPSRPQARSERFDAAGGALLALSVGCLLLALNQVRHLTISAPFAIVAAAGLVLFYRQEHRIPKPIIDFVHFRRPGFTLINVENALVNLAAFSIMLLAPFYLHEAAGLSLPQSGLVLAVSPIGIVLGAPIAGRLAANRPPRLVALAGMIASAAGLFGISLAGPHPDLLWLGASMLLQGVGIGVFQVAYFEIVTASIPLEQRGVAGALGMATRTIGTVMGATVLMLLFQTVRGPVAGVAALVGAFQATFRFAAAIPTVLVLLEALLLWRSGLIGSATRAAGTEPR
ncbi:MAG: hypothetical protein B7Z80_16005 [Rhodospirillales bacterium 20-64-7]|nr:MAG: hypothetical protein B7Z80_16005 [Rhodospirillales bacterium 20-64-7]HQT78457.1 MFS transporter [Rhodopila sp.]